MTVDPTARFVYIAIFDNNNISLFGIGSDGALTPVSGSPFATGAGPVSVAVDPMAEFAYVANIDSNDISAYRIGSSGTLTTVQGSPFPAREKLPSLAITRLLPSPRD